jgi:hypothetical protein
MKRALGEIGKMKVIKIALAISMAVLLISNIFVGASNTIRKVNVPLQEKEEIFEDFWTYVANIEDEEQKERIEDILNLITVNGEIDEAAAIKLAQDFYDIANSRIGNPLVDDTPPDYKHSLNINENSPQSSAKSVGGSTVFEPPYSDNFSWGEKSGIWDDEAHSGNDNSGAVGSFGMAIVGYGVAEGMQRLDFFVGDTKYLHVRGEVLRTGGKKIFGLAAFAGTYITRAYDDFIETYKVKEVDSAWDWFEIVTKIIGVVSFLKMVTIGTIQLAIMWLGRVNLASSLLAGLLGMLDDNEAEYRYIDFNFTAHRGWHSVWIGLRSQASACLTGYGNGTSIGQVTNITIFGIAAPDPPVINGVTDGKIGETYDFSVSSTDPNDDPLKYKIKWGDGAETGWTDFVEEGTEFAKSHRYTETGIYTITAIAQDIDMMQSKTTMNINIHENRAPDKPTISGPLSGQPGIEYAYTFVSTDPDNDGLRYKIKWGEEGVSEEGPGNNPHDSGEVVTFHNTWNKRGTHVVKARATDTDGAQSEWETLEISMPKEKEFIFTILSILRNRIPFMTKLGFF